MAASLPASLRWPARSSASCRIWSTTSSAVAVTGSAWAATTFCQEAPTAGRCASRASSQISLMASRSVMVWSVPPLSSASHSSQRACCAQPPRSISRRWKAVSAASSVRPSRSAARRMARSGVSGALATCEQKPVRPAISGVRSCTAHSRQAAKVLCPGAGDHSAWPRSKWPAAHSPKLRAMTEGQSLPSACGGEIRDRRKGLHRRPLLREFGLQCGDVLRLQRRGGGRKRVGEILFAHLSRPRALRHRSSGAR